ncbi:MAG: hypothetical protein U1F98_00420 [Verrucomicrobiota bacterium]
MCSGAESAPVQSPPPPPAPAATNSEALKAESDFSGAELPLEYHAEIKRQFTNRGSPQESSRTTLRLEYTPDGPFTLYRVDIPFVDKKNGDPGDPGLGDIKTRMDLHPFAAGATELGFFEETTFPSANPKSLGNGKYQLGLGAEQMIPIAALSSPQTAPKWSTTFTPLLEQTFSVAGDASFPPINYTKLELALKTSWRRTVSLKLNPKFTFDWVGGEDSGAVIELEPSWNITRRWNFSVTLGHGMFGVGVPGTYNRKIEWDLQFSF